jgi:hypothetical protein
MKSYHKAKAWLGYWNPKNPPDFRHPSNGKKGVGRDNLLRQDCRKMVDTKKML